MSALANNIVTLTVHFLDGTQAAYRYARQSGTTPADILASVKRAIDADKLVLEVEGDLMVIPIASVKYVQVSPAPPQLPSGVLRQARPK
jgi:hypothetical protein